MNNKGFTLIEILAVIVIISVVTLIGTVSVTGIKSKIEKNMLETKIDIIIAGGKSWGQDNKSFLLKETGNRTNKSVNELIASEDIETDEVEEPDSYGCTKKDASGNCYVVNNNVEGNVLNDLRLRIYLEHNRVYACIEKTTDNYNLLGDDASGSIYAHLNYYCA